MWYQNLILYLSLSLSHYIDTYVIQKYITNINPLLIFSAFNLQKLIIMTESEKISRRLSKPCILLIVISGMERFAFKGVASNLVTYLTDVLKMSNSTAAKTVNGWCGFTSLLPLLVAPLVDSYWDRFSTILVSCFLYAGGLLALTSTSIKWPWIHMKQATSSSSLFAALYMISLGQGGYNPSLQAFGADQIEEDDELPINKNEKGSDKKSIFFHWWYFGICVGSLLGVTLMAYIQDNFGWGLGFAMPAMSMIASFVLFSCGTRFYTYKQPKSVSKGSFERIVQMIKGVASKMVNRRIVIPSNNSDAADIELQEKPLCLQEDESLEPLDDTSTRKEVYLFEILKVVIRLFPIWAMLLMFAVIFQQPPTFFTKQGMTMKRNIGPHFKIPPATLQSAITMSIILLMPMYDAIFIPFSRFIMRNESGISVMQRMGTGMFLSVIAMVLAALVETKRLQLSNEMPEKENVLSIFWMLPQYIILGIADIFTVVGMQEFFYTEVPVGMRTMGIALYTSVFGVGSFMSALLITMVEYFSSLGGKQSWFSDDMSKARLDKYYWLLAFLCAFSLFSFVIACRFFKSRTT